jgi:hypothetical protein
MRFQTRDLLHNWGFEDGDILMGFLHGHDFDLGDVNHKDILESVVLNHVLPAIRNAVEWRVISTMHNPVRVTSVDGVKVDNLRVDHPDVALVPEFVDVADEVILAYAKGGLPSG